MGLVSEFVLEFTLEMALDVDGATGPSCVHKSAQKS